MSDDVEMKPAEAAAPAAEGDVEMKPAADPSVVTLAEGGVVKRVLRPGHPGGECPPRHAEVTMQYVGRLTDGTEFDRSSPSRPFKFKLGEGQVIKGWDLGVATMIPGERAELTCKPEYAYGAAGSPPKIPKDATLVFEVELVEYTTKKSVTEDGGVSKEVLAEGQGYNRPNLFATVTFRYTGRLAGPEGRVFDSAHEVEPRTMVLDQADGATRGLEEALKNMLKGERARFYVKPSYGYGAAGNPALGVPPNASLVYEVELLDFTKARETWEMSEEEKVEHALRLKERGNAQFKSEDYEGATRWYRKALDVFRYEGKLSDATKARVRELKTQAASNLAACAIKQDKFADAVSAAKESLEADPKNAKALYRRGFAQFKLGSLDEAEADLKRAGELDPSNAAVGETLKRVHAQQRVIREKEKKMFGNIFQRLSAEEEAESKKKEQAKPAAPATESATESAPESAPAPAAAAESS